jgi:hypothetical protein
MKSTLAIAALLSAAPANAEVLSSSSSGFEVRHTATVPVAPDAAFAAFAKVERWWDPAHSFGGDASKLSLDARAGGCFCESLPGGGVEHLRVAFVDKPKRLVMNGALGPLVNLAVAGVMDVRFEPAGAGTRVTLDYKAAGFAAGGAKALAPAVDQVLGQQFTRYAAFARAE